MRYSTQLALYRVVTISALVAIAFTIVGFQSWRRFPLLYLVICAPTAFGYFAGRSDQVDADWRLLNKTQKAIAATESSPYSLSEKIEALDRYRAALRGDRDVD